MTATISLVGVVRDAASQLPEWIRRGRVYADEVVVCVDSASVDGTFDVARSLADVALRFEHSPCSDDAIDWAMRQAQGDWIVRLDDDECLGSDLVAALPRLVADRHLTHYYIPRRWVVRDEASRLCWLDRPPWNPEWALRLHRNVGSIWRHEGGAHQRVQIDGEGRFIDPLEGVIWHMDLAWRSRIEREAKVRLRYDRIAPWIVSAPLYLWEDSARPEDFRPVPAGELERWWPATRAPLTEPADTPQNSLDRPPAHPLSARLLDIAQHRDDPPVFAAEYLSHGVPERLEAGRPLGIEVTVRNVSATRWRNSGRVRGRVVLVQGWESSSGRRAGGTALLPHSVERGESATVRLALWPPKEPGRYRTLFDLTAEGVETFSRRGVTPLVVEVEVVAVGAA